MKKQVVSVLLTAAMTAGMLAGCGSSTASTSKSASAGSSSSSSTAASSSAASTSTAASSNSVASGSTEAVASTSGAAGVGEATGKYALVPKSAGNPFNEREASGFQDALKALGCSDDQIIVSYPDNPTADSQITVIQSLISQGVSSIAVAANDASALDAALKQASDAGIKVCTLDSDVDADYRSVFCNQAGVKEIAQALMDAVYDISGGSGEYAILSATSQATNQNAWIAAMKEIAESDSKYADLKLDEIAYGDDEAQKSTDQTQALLTKYPDLKVICSPTTVGIAAAAKVLQDQKSSVKLTGLGLPSEMKEYIGDDDSHSCPYMFLWNPIDLGALAAYTSVALVNGTITGAVGDTFTAGDLNDGNPYTITENSDKASEIILGQPFKFDPSNIEEWAEVY
ncbi:MAG: substrate-binding domain-containing protein [Bilifractor sp.]|jgi:rhamnose transport system substrate-binding protein|nr:substrate-binding domain-containing protein [Lachnospiraceae bacterium]MDY2838027.1 substrate-binding domain-containing protein [Bilifractor sp.]